MHATAQSLLAQLRQNPLDSVALQALKRHVDHHGDLAVWAEAMELHTRALADADGDPIELGRLHLELGNLYRDKLGRQDRAIAHYRSAIDFDAAQRAAMVAARGIYASAGKWDQVVKLLEREADSLPEGPKRTALLQELGAVYKRELGDSQAAIKALREACGYAPNDLHVRHELATLLLEQADRESDGFRGEEYRREAADVLCAMASKVSDDYAFAYVEAALDAAPDHGPGLALLERIAPRVGRTETIPPRWVAGLQASPEGPLSRELRLKLAKAYHGVGQQADARACLEPLLARGDEEAARLSGSFDPPASTSGEALLDDDLVAGEASQSGELGEQIATLRDSAPGKSPLADLAQLSRSDATVQEPFDFPEADHDQEAVTFLGEDASQSAVDLVSSSELTMAGDELAAELRSASQDDLEADDDIPGAATRPRAHAPGDLTMVSDEEPEFEDAGDVSSSFFGSEPGAAAQPQSEPVRTASAPPNPQTSSTEAPRQPADLLSASLAGVPDEAEIHDPHAEVTQPRAPGAELPAAAHPATPEPAAIPTDPTPAVPIRIEGGALRRDSTAPVRDSGSPKRLGPPEPKRAADLGSVSQPIGNDLAALRKELEKRIRFRDRRGAAEIAEAMLVHDGTDEGAIAALEDHYRTTRDFKRMRELAMRIGREAALPAETRVTRLREAAMLSESKLGDLEGTITAWRALLALLPGDEEGNGKLRKLYARHARWDDLAQMIDAQLKGEADAARRGALYRELGLVQRDKRKDLDAAIEAFASARDVDSGRGDDDVILSELYVSARRFAEAASAYEARLASTEEPVERIPLLRTLAEIYEHELGDDGRALEATDALLTIAPRDGESIERLIRIGERTDQPERWIDGLTRKLGVSESGSHAAVYARIAEIAFSRLNDAERAAQAYRDALTRAPADAALQSAAEPVFDAAGRRKDLTELFTTLAHSARDPNLRAGLLRKVAHRERDDGQLDAAISAFEQLLIVSRDREALSDLVELLRRAERFTELTVRLDALANVSEPAVARDLRFERAQIFADKLARIDSAKAELERILSDLAPEDVPALTLLSELAERSHDLPLYARSEERRMRLVEGREARIEIADKLATVCEDKLKDDDAAIRALEYWTSLDGAAPQPYLRVVPLYERTGRDQELLSALDALAALAVDETEAGEYLLRAARVAMKSQDHDGAWNRLVPRVVDGDDAQAEALLCELAESTGRGKELAELYVGLAQRQADPTREKQRWMDAARIYEKMVGAADRALEALLRALAKDASNVALLDEADRLAEAARAWPRLTQVYDALARRADSADARIRILMRVSTLLEQRASDLDGAYERAALAFQLEPNRDDTYLEAKRLARAAERTEDLLSLHERRASGAGAIATRMEALLEACAAAQHVLGDAPRATGYLSRAVVVVAGDENLLRDIEVQVRELDMAQPPIDGRGLTHALAEVYKLRAEEEKRDAKLAALLLSRAAELFSEQLDDREAAYRALERAATLAPADESVLDALLAAAERAGRFEPLAEHLQKLADDAIDSTTASAALKRLGALVRGPLNDPNRAAEVYKQLVMLRPRDGEASGALRACLKEAARYKDLLIALDRELAIAATPSERLGFLREAAETWERGLNNRFEARDAWKKVLAAAPNDDDARAALERLEARPSIDERSLLEADLVVLPEDLNPSLPPAPPEPEPSPAEAETSAEQGEEHAAESASEPAPEASSDTEAPPAGESGEDQGLETAAPSEPMLSSDEGARSEGELSESKAASAPPPPFAAASEPPAGPPSVHGEPWPPLSPPSAEAPSAAHFHEEHGGTAAPALASAAPGVPVEQESESSRQPTVPEEEGATAAPAPQDGPDPWQELVARSTASLAPPATREHDLTLVYQKSDRPDVTMDARDDELENVPAPTFFGSDVDQGEPLGAPTDVDQGEPLGAPTVPAPRPELIEEELRADESAELEAAEDVASGEVSLDEAEALEADEDELEVASTDTDPSELADADADEADELAPPPTGERTGVPPAPAPPWTAADAPGQSARPAAPDLLADLQSLDDMETLEGDQVELEALDEEPVPADKTENLDTLTNMLERGPSQPPKPRMPPPPAPSTRPSAGPSAPPPVPARTSAPPPLPGTARPTSPTPVPPPPPTRRS